MSEEGSDDLPYRAEYAKSGRAKCKEMLFFHRLLILKRLILFACWASKYPTFSLTSYVCSSVLPQVGPSCKQHGPHSDAFLSCWFCFVVAWPIILRVFLFLINNSKVWLALHVEGLKAIWGLSESRVDMWYLLLCCLIKWHFGLGMQGRNSQGRLPPGLLDSGGYLLFRSNDKDLW